MIVLNDSPRILDEPAFWISIVSALAALLSAAFAYWSARTSKKMLRLAEGSEHRRQPRLVPHFGEGYCRVRPDLKRRVYVFTILINNPTDSANSVTRIELQVGYTTDNHDYVTLKLPHVSGHQETMFGDQPLLRLPLLIEAHGSVAGSVIFYLDDALVERTRIDNFKLLITDSHDETTRLEPVIIRDLIDAKQIETT
jgi:hypothetical protein